MLRKIGIYTDKLRMLFQKECLLLSIYFTLVAVYYHHVNLNPVGQEFDRTFNQMIYSGQSLSGRLSGMNTLIFIYFPLMFILSYFLFSFLAKKDSVYFRIMNECAGLFCLILPFYFLSRYETADLTVKEAPLVDLSLLIILALLIASYVDRKKKLDASAIYATLLLSVSEVISFRLLFHTKAKAAFFVEHSEYMCAILFLLQLLILIFVKFKNNEEYIVLKVLAAAVAWLPFLLLLRVEFFYISAGQGQPESNQYLKLMWVALLVLLSAMALIAVWILGLHKKFRLPSVSWRMGYLGLILGIAAINWFPGFSKVFDYANYNNMFEIGNQTSVTETILFGQMPVSNYFSAHLLSDIWTRGLYYLFNGDLLGVLADSYLSLDMVVKYVMLYMLLNRLFGKDKAFWVVFLLPVCMRDIMWSSVNFIAVVALIYLIKKNNLWSYILYWSALLFGLLYQLDAGYGIGIGCVVALVLLVLFKKIRLKWIPFMASAFGVALLFLVYFIIGCIREGVPVFSRIWEFLSVSLLSNSTWAVRAVADLASREYFLLYLFVPVFTLIMLVVTILKRKEVCDKHLPLYCAVIAFGVSQLLFMPRILVLHTYNTGVTSWSLLSFFHLLVALFVAFIFRHKDKLSVVMFFAVFVAMIYLEGIFINGFIPSLNNSAGVLAYDNSEVRSIEYDESMGEKRVTCSENTVAFMSEFNLLFDVILEKDDTFLDFSNVTGLYAMLNRENPVYVSQSPSLLSTEYSQKCFIEEIERHGKVQVAVLANKEDQYIDAMIGTKHPIRYYLVAEYIYSNFVPLTTVGDFAIWCRKDSYDYMSEQISYIGKEAIDYTYADKVVFHSYQLGQVPRYWANYDTKNAIDAPLVKQCDVEEGLICYPNVGKIEKENGNYLAFKVNQKENGSGDGYLYFRDKDNNTLTEFSFDTVPGECEYLIRISSDFMWYSGLVDHIAFVFEKECMVSNVRILEGD